jgi:hypothetical protein
MKAYGGFDVGVHIFLTSVPDGGEWSASRPSRFTPGERAPNTHWIGDWVDPRAGLDNMEKRKFLTLLGLERQPLGHPAHTQLLYRLRYPGSQYMLFANLNYRFVLSAWEKILTAVNQLICGQSWIPVSHRTAVDLYQSLKKECIVYNSCRKIDWNCVCILIRSCPLMYTHGTWTVTSWNSTLFFCF